MLSEEQVKQIKKQLLEQIKNFPPQQREVAEKQIKEMNAEQLEKFLIQNNLIKDGQQPATLDGNLETQVAQTGQSSQPDQSQAQTQQCIFCSISSGKTQTYKIDENKDSVAVLEINPVSKSHALIIPKKHDTAEKVPSSAFTLAKKVAKKIKTKFKPKNVEISTSVLFGHAIINILPVYDNESLSGERKPASSEELKELQKALEKKKVVRKDPIVSRKPGKKLPEMPKRFP